MKLAIGSDHAGFEYKEKLTRRQSKHEIKDFVPTPRSLLITLTLHVRCQKPLKIMRLLWGSWYVEVQTASPLRRTNIREYAQLYAGMKNSRHSQENTIMRMCFACRRGLSILESLKRLLKSLSRPNLKEVVMRHAVNKITC